MIGSNISEKSGVRIYINNKCLFAWTILGTLINCKASAVSKGTQSSVQQKTCSSVDLIDQLVRTASVVFTLPVLPGVQSSMTCLCLETSLIMQRSH